MSKNPIGDYVVVRYFDDDKRTVTSEIYTAYNISIDITDGCLVLSLEDDEGNLDEIHAFASGVWYNYQMGYRYSDEDPEV